MPVAPTNLINPLLPPAGDISVTNSARVYTNCAVKTPTLFYDNVTIYGGSNAFKGAVVFAWDKSLDPTVGWYKVYYGPVTQAVTNSLTTRAYVNTLLFYGLSTNDTYWVNVASVATNGTESFPSNTLLLRP